MLTTVTNLLISCSSAETPMLVWVFSCKLRAMALWMSSFSSLSWVKSITSAEKKKKKRLSTIPEHTNASQRGVRTWLVTLDKSGRFTFPMFFRRSHLMRNNMAFIMKRCKNIQVWIWKYCHFERSARLHSDRFGVFIFLYTIFQAFRTWRHISKIQWKHMENPMRIQKLAESVLPHTQVRKSLSLCYHREIIRKILGVLQLQ